METKMENLEMSPETLKSEVSRLKRSLRNTHIFYNVFYLTILLIILLFWKSCSSKENKEHLENLNEHIGYELNLQNIIDNLQQLKPVLNIQDTVINEHSGQYVNAILVGPESKLAQGIFFPDCRNKFRKPRPVQKPVIVPCPEVVCPSCPQLPVDTCKQKVCLDSLLNDSLHVCMDKQYREVDSSRILLDKKMQLAAFFLKNPPAIDYTHTYTEYLQNPYRLKAENSFKRAVISAIVSTGLYATSEALGHPKYFDARDNSAADKKHNEIFLLRAGSLITGLYSGFEFGRVVYFHHMESKFIVYPTRITLTIDLDKPAGK